MKRVGGFALAEVAIALILVTMVTFLLSSLGTQVMNLARSSKQTSAVLELRSKTNSISKNTSPWLAEMRSSPITGSLYSGCLPDNSTVTAPLKYSCPAINDAILKSDTELGNIAGSQLHIASSPIVDAMGEQIAGTENAPLYIDSDGRPCTNTNAGTSCPMKSTGYLLRSNSASDGNPGYVKFVVKVERNLASIAKTGNITPMKAQYLNLEIGNDWQSSSSTCPTGTLKMGYLTTGTAYCVSINSAATCATGKFQVGVDSSGGIICKDLPSPPCTAGSAILDPKSNEFICSQSSPCASGEIFTGYFSGTGSPMCSSLNVSCPTGQMQVGMTQDSSGKLTATCDSLPSCKDTEKLSYDGSKFVCESGVTLASACPDNQVVVGTNADGSIKCQAPDRNLASSNLDCPDGQYVSGLNKDGSVKCKGLPSTSGQLIGGCEIYFYNAGQVTRFCWGSAIDAGTTFSCPSGSTLLTLAAVEDHIAAGETSHGVDLYAGCQEFSAIGGHFCGVGIYGCIKD